jgi:hypothetical protein
MRLTHFSLRPAQAGFFISSNRRLQMMRLPRVLDGWLDDGSADNNVRDDIEASPSIDPDFTKAQCSFGIDLHSGKSVASIDPC